MAYGLVGGTFYKSFLRLIIIEAKRSRRIRHDLYIQFHNFGVDVDACM